MKLLITHTLHRVAHPRSEGRPLTGLYTGLYTRLCTCLYACLYTCVYTSLHTREGRPWTGPCTCLYTCLCYVYAHVYTHVYINSYTRLAIHQNTPALVYTHANTYACKCLYTCLYTCLYAGRDSCLYTSHARTRGFTLDQSIHIYVHMSLHMSPHQHFDLRLEQLDFVRSRVRCDEHGRVAIAGLVAELVDA